MSEFKRLTSEDIVHLQTANMLHIQPGLVTKALSEIQGLRPLEAENERLREGIAKVLKWASKPGSLDALQKILDGLHAALKGGE